MYLEFFSRLQCCFYFSIARL